MYYPTVQDVEFIIEKLNRRYNMNVTIINRGQLDFALEVMFPIRWVGLFLPPNSHRHR